MEEKCSFNILIADPLPSDDAVGRIDESTRILLLDVNANWKTATRLGKISI